MSECRFIVYFEYAERRGEEDEVFNGCPKGGVVIKIQSSKFKVLNIQEMII